MNELKYEKTYTITTNQRNCFDILSPCGLFDFLQDIAGRHVIELGYGFETLIKKNMIWVLARSKYEVINDISNADTIKITTWPHYPGKLDFDRDFLITDLDNKPLIKATTKWCIIDYTTRRFLPANNLIFDGVYLEDKNYTEVFRPLKNLDLINDYEKSYTFIVKFHQTDHNQHLNNSRYAEEICNALKLKKDEMIKAFEINFVKEVILDQEVTIYYKKIENEYFLEGYNEKTLIFKSRVETWIK